MGFIGLLVYVTLPCWLPNTIVERFDLVALGFAAFIALPWLVSCLDEIEIGGVRAKWRKVEERAEEAGNQAFDARNLVDELVMSRGTTEQEQRPDLAHAPEALSESDKEVADSKEALRELAQRYVSVRESMPSGAARTARMTEIFGKLQGLSKRIPRDQGDVLGWLTHEDAGLQLAAIAWLRAHPDSATPGNLIEAIERSSQPFVQYWALRVLNEHVDQKGAREFSPLDLGRLQGLEGQLGRRTDRRFLLYRLNRKLDDAL